ncbi:MAG: hypothetical protein QM571_01810 [Micrococcaceae bacterium]
MRGVIDGQPTAETSPDATWQVTNLYTWDIASTNGIGADEPTRVTTTAQFKFVNNALSNSVAIDMMAIFMVGVPVLSMVLEQHIK